MTVVFYVDPAMAKDSDNAETNTITLSYTFYRQREPSTAGRRRRADSETNLLNGDCNGRRTRQTAPRLPPRQSEPVAGGRLDLGLRDGGRRDLLDAPHVRRRAAGVRRRRDRRALHLAELVARRHQGGAGRGLPHPRRADFAPLRHDPVHRLRGDVLRRLVLGLFRRRAVSRTTSSRSRAANSSAASGRRIRRRTARSAAPSIRGTCRCSTR